MENDDHCSSGERNDRGSALPVVAFGLAALVIAALLLGLVSHRITDRARAQAAADAAALAGVIEGRSGAAELAEANGARLVDFRQTDDRVVVVVDHRGVRARAAAEVGVMIPTGE